mmetsp:Transcript_38830/g.44427  ORF Transcript_38830/g.44427 Transcript_38830/m.44427 type:complete len:94 (-) Transcript_38830:618-899(-)
MHAKIAERDQILEKIKRKERISKEEYDRLYEIFEIDYYNKQRYVQQSVLLSIPGFSFDIIVLGEETTKKDTFLEAVKSDYNYVKYNIGMAGEK